MMTNWNGPAFTPVVLSETEKRIAYTDLICMIGSCFSENIASRLQRNEYQVISNPFGILYNPFSIAGCLRRIISKELYVKEELLHHQSMYHSPDHHGSYSGKDPETVIAKINTALLAAHDHLRRCQYVFISPGTTIVYRHKASGKIVGNCHKIPQSAFASEKLNFEACHALFDEMIQMLTTFAPDASICFTVSPVRHIRDGLTVNSRSKACLLLTIEEVMMKHAHVSYFPAFELMMDQLRDYRYYDQDMIHPSAEAVGILWDSFCAVYIDKNDQLVHQRIEKIKRAAAHRFLHDDQEAVRVFAQKQLQQIEALQTEFPFLQLAAEKKYFLSHISPG